MTPWIGIIGMLCILTAFVLQEWVTKINEDTISYNLLNIIGSGLLVYYAFTIASWPFIILNGVWCLTALVKLIKVAQN